MPREEKKQGLKVIHSTPGGWDASQYHYAPELQREKAEGTGITKGMGDCKMNHQPTHKTPTSRGYDRLNPKRKAPKTWNISDKQAPANPGAEPEPAIDEAVQKDLKKRNLKTKDK